MIVACRSHARAKDALIGIYRRNYARENKHEAGIRFGMRARIQQVFAVIQRKRPVIVFAGTVDPFERFFVQKAGKIVLFRHLFHDFHHQLVVICRSVGIAEHGRKFVLRGRHFVVF